MLIMNLTTHKKWWGTWEKLVKYDLKKYNEQVFTKTNNKKWLQLKLSKINDKIIMGLKQIIYYIIEMGGY